MAIILLVFGVYVLGAVYSGIRFRIRHVVARKTCARCAYYSCIREYCVNHDGSDAGIMTVFWPVTLWYVVIADLIRFLADREIAEVEQRTAIAAQQERDMAAVDALLFSVPPPGGPAR